MADQQRGTPLQSRQVDLKAGEVRLDPETMKNMEGRVFHLTVALKKLLAEQRKAANRVQRQKGRPSEDRDARNPEQIVSCWELAGTILGTPAQLLMMPASSCGLCASCTSGGVQGDGPALTN